MTWQERLLQNLSERGSVKAPRLTNDEACRGRRLWAGLAQAEPKLNSSPLIASSAAADVCFPLLDFNCLL